MGAGNKIWFPGRGKNFSAPALPEWSEFFQICSPTSSGVCSHGDMFPCHGPGNSAIRGTMRDTRGAVKGNLLLLLLLLLS